MRSPFSLLFHKTTYSITILVINAPIKQGELQSIRNSVNGQAPLEDEKWQVETVSKYGMLTTLNKRGKPRKMCKVACLLFCINSFVYSYINSKHNN